MPSTSGSHAQLHDGDAGNGGIGAHPQLEVVRSLLSNGPEERALNEYRVYSFQRFASGRVRRGDGGLAAWAVAVACAAFVAIRLAESFALGEGGRDLIAQVHPGDSLVVELGQVMGDPAMIGAGVILALCLISQSRKVLWRMYRHMHRLSIRG